MTGAKKADAQRDALDPRAGSPGQRSRLHAATENQSSVSPQDYPATDRGEQRTLSNPDSAEKASPAATKRG